MVKENIKPSKEDPGESIRSIYKDVLKQAWIDGALTYDEISLIDRIRMHLGITIKEHQTIESELLKERRLDPSWQAYTAVLEQALLDGIVTADEQAILKRLRIILHISEKEHNVLEQKILEKMKVGDLASNQKSVAGGEVDKVRGDVDYWLNKGEELWSSIRNPTEEAAQALECFDKVIALDPLNFHAWSNKGVILKRLNRSKEAIMCYNQAIEIRPDQPTPWYNKGLLLAFLEKYTESITCLEKVLEISPDHKLAKRDLRSLKEAIERGRGVNNGDETQEIIDNL